MVGFSTYVWNGRISLEIARRLKALKPGIVIVFGGPHVPDQPEAFLRANPADRPRRPQRGRADLPEAAGNVSPTAQAWRRHSGRQHGQAPTAASSAIPEHRSRARPRRDPVALPRRARSTRSWPPTRRELDRPVGDQPRLPVPLHLLRLGLGHRRPRSPSSARSGSIARSTGSPQKKIEYIFCCDANFGIQKRDVDIANYVADVKKETGYPGGAVGPEHQERHRARLRDAEDPVRRRPEQGRGAVHAERRQADAGGDQARQHLARHLHGAAAPLHPRQGRDLFRPDPGPARRDLRILRARASTC